uniref:FLYWCH-type domain-containing protein n=1 Tax=Glossina austeni TaxID=7395 RepID=A0A1A9VHY7_GLOAU
MPAIAKTGQVRQPLIRKRGRPRKTDLNSQQPKMKDKIEECVNNHPGEPAVYASTTKGTVKLIYEGHHFRYSFRKGKYSIFQCCYKENKEECKVRVVTDHKRVYPLDGEHVHFVQATDKSVTAVKFSTGEENLQGMNVITMSSAPEVEEISEPDSQHIVSLDEQFPEFAHSAGDLNADVKVEAARSETPTEYSNISKVEVAPSVAEIKTASGEEANDFREKIKKLMQHVQHVRDCGAQLFIISRKGGTLLAINDFIYRSNLKRFGPLGDKVYWECIQNRSKKCRSRLKTIGDDLYVTNDVHNHAGDRERIELARRSGMLIYRKFSAIGILTH